MVPLEKLKWTEREKDEVAWEGLIGLVRKGRTVREVIVDKFISANPLIAAEIAKIGVKDAEDRIGKVELENYVTKKTYYKYEVIERKEQTEEKKNVQIGRTTKKNKKKELQAITTR